MAKYTQSFISPHKRLVLGTLVDNKVHNSHSSYIA